MQVAFNLTQNKENAEDLVQELYLYLLEMKNIEKIKYNNTVNLYYLYKTLRSKFLNGVKKTTKLTILPVEEDFLEIAEEEYLYEKDEEFEKMLALTKHLLETEVHWYDKKLLETYIMEDHSIASLHEATGISKSSIWTTLNKTKEFIKRSYEKNQQQKSGSI